MILNKFNILKAFLIVVMCCSGFNSQAQMHVDWHQIYFSNSYFFINGVTTDSSNNIYTVGRIGGNFDFDPSANTALLPNNSVSFLEKKGPDGAFQWVYPFVGSGDMIPLDMIVAPDNSILIAGSVNDYVDFSPGASQNGFTTTNYYGFLISLTQNGTLNWSKGWSSNNQCRIECLEVNSNNEIILCANYHDIVNLNPDFYTPDTANTELSASFISKIGANGVTLSTKVLGGGSAVKVSELKLDSEGNTYIVGEYTGDFVQDDITLTTTTIFSNGFIMKLDTNFSAVWAKEFGGMAVDKVVDLDITSSNELFVLGNMSGDQDLDPDSAVYYSIIPKEDAVVWKYDADGNLKYLKRFPSSGGFIDRVNPESIAANNNGSFYLTGNLVGGISAEGEFGPAMYQSNNKQDIFMIHCNSEGRADWGGLIQGTENCDGYEVEIDLNGDAIFVGLIQGYVDIDPGPTERICYSKYMNGYIMKVAQNWPLQISDASAKSFELFPNPASEQITVQAYTAIQSIAILDLSGRVVVDQSMEKSNFQLSLSNLQPGIYLMQCITEYGRVTKPFVVQ